MFNPLALGADCAHCPFAVNGQPTKPVPCERPKRARGVLVGEGPGLDEVAQGRPFVGNTGRQLDEELLLAGIARRDLFVINGEACLPRGVHSPAAVAKAVKCCAPAFEAQLAPYRKLPAFTMGRGAWLAYAGSVPKGGLEDGRGFLRTHPDTGVTYIAAHHPTFAFFHNPYVWGVFRADLKRFWRLLWGKLRPRPSTIIPNATWRDILRLLLRRTPLSCDIESAPFKPDMPWTGKDFHLCRLRTVGLGDEDFGLSVRWDTADARTKQALVDAVDRAGIIYQNGAWADRRVLSRYHFRMHPKWEDTRDARRALSATSKLGLDFLASLYDDTPVWWSEGLATHAPQSLDEWAALMTYNAYDCCEQARVFAAEQAEEEWQTPRVQRLYEVHKKLAVIAAKMHTRGFQLNYWARGILAVGLEELHEKRLAKLKKAVGIPGFTGSPNHMRAIIYRRHETADIKLFSLADPAADDMYTDETCQVCSVDQDVLLRLLTYPETPPELAKIVDLYWQANAPQKARSTYVVSEKVEHAIGPDGRLRSGWNSCGADTGRWSSSDPNLMNLSEEKD